MTSPFLADLISAAWAAQFRDPAHIAPIAGQIIDGSADRSVDRAWGHLHMAWAMRFRRDAEAAKLSLARAEDAFATHAHEAGLAACRDLRARECVDAGDEAGARDLIAMNSAVPTESRTVWERVVANKVEFAFANRFLSSEDALRVASREIVVARMTNDDAVIGQALSMLGGKHAELNNYETALSICREAYDRTRPLKPGTAWYISALNLLLAYNGTGDADAARQLADELIEIDDSIFPSIREQSNILYARAFLLCGDTAAAQAALDRSRVAVPVQNHAHSWTATQAGVHIAQGEVGRARELCEAWIANTPRDEMFLSPSVALRIHRTAAAACEALGDLRAALNYERQAAEYNEIELGRAARARRIALEVEFDLERERSARDEAEKQRHKSEAERIRLDELNRQLDAALQTRTRFLAAASHDLRQPAHALALYATALQQETSRTALHALAHRMRATVSSLSGMFDGLIDLARIDAGVVDVRVEAMNLDEMLARLCGEYSDGLAGRNSRLALHTARAPLFLNTDPMLLERVLRNLISNAVKYAGDGNILVALRWRGDGWTIEVRDHGPGIAHTDQRRVFDEFFQVAGHGDRREGLGLGLAIVERFARLLGMTITLRSCTTGSQRGSTFCLTIPASLVTLPASAVAIEAMATGAVPRDIQALCIVVIDDDKDARTSLALVLEQWGHSASCGTHADAVIDDCQHRGVVPDAIITDFQLDGGRTGIDEIARLRATFGADLPALVVSGAHDSATRAAVDGAGAAYLTKPVRPLRLKSWLSAVRPRA